MTPSRDPRLARSLSKDIPIPIRGIDISDRRHQPGTPLVALSSLYISSLDSIERRPVVAPISVGDNAELIISDNLANCMNHLFLLHCFSQVRGDTYNSIGSHHVSHTQSLSRYRDGLALMHS